MENANTIAARIGGKTALETEHEMQSFRVLKELSKPVLELGATAEPGENVMKTIRYLFSDTR